MAKSISRVVIVGSLNIDYIAAVERLPTAGETVAATGLIQRFGGKGANQAVAAARQGASVSMIGCVGADDPGRAYCRRLCHERIDASGITTTARALTGTALIAVDQRGENMIVVAAGANGELRPGALRDRSRLIQSADTLLLQLEIPMPTVIEAVRIGNRAQVPVVLNPSPWREGFPWGKCVLDTVVANRHEAQAILGLDIGDSPDHVIHPLRRRLREYNIGRVIITRGAKPTICVGPEEHYVIPTLPVTPVDTVGAGDAFAGAFVARRAEGLDVRNAVWLANCAGALATLKRGAQESIPTRSATARAAARSRSVCLYTA